MTRSVFHRRQPVLGMRAAAENEAEILLYDEISPWFISARQFVADLKALEVDTIHLHINSPGGDVFEGVAIYNALKAHKAKIIVHIDGIAASIASLVALAGDEILIAKNAMFMIHEPSGLAWGTATDLRRTADLLDKVGDATLVGTYVAVTGQEEQQIRDWMRDETWFDAEEAVEAGFCDAVDEEADAVAAAFDLSVYNRVPAHLAAMAKPSRREAERALRDAGFSRREARQNLAARHTPAAPAARDALDDGLLKSLRQLADTIGA